MPNALSSRSILLQMVKIFVTDGNVLFQQIQVNLFVAFCDYFRQQERSY